MYIDESNVSAHYNLKLFVGNLFSLRFTVKEK